MYKFAGQRAQWRLGGDITTRFKLRRKKPPHKTKVRQQWYQRIKESQSTGASLPTGMPLWLSVEVRALSRARWLALYEAKYGPNKR